VSLLLLPRLGTGNPVPFHNNYAVAKDGNPWSDGGSDTFDGTTGAQITTASGWARLGGNTYTTADGSIDISKSLGIDGVDVGVYSGWAVAGIWACEIELGSDPRVPLHLRFWCNTGYDNGSPTGIVTKAFTLAGNDYELKTVWTSYGQQDSWASTNETQLTVTVVPYLAAQNLAGVNPFTWSGSGDDRDYRLNGVTRGATLYIQWGKVNVDAVQDWIIGDLAESEEFASAPHERTLLLNTAPGARLQALNRFMSPNSELWSRAGGLHLQFRAVPRNWRDIHFGGHGVIAGTVKEKATQNQAMNQALVRRVQLISTHTNLLVAETWSSPDGSYWFERIDTRQRYTVVSFDHERHYRAVIADDLSPAVMP
jgi:hypothetical protein